MSLPAPAAVPIEGATAPGVVEAAPIPSPARRTEAVPIPRPTGFDVPVPLLLGGGAVLAVAVVLLLRLNPSSALATLLLQRGWTQYASLYLASATAVFLGIKGARLGITFTHLRQADTPRRAERWTPEDLASVERARDAYVRQGYPVALRRARAMQAFLMTGRRSAAVAAAEEDAALAQAAADASYAAPRAMIWAIPLMGFIGTVIGISAAIAGFSDFLQQAEEIEQIKTAIGGVTTGLAVAFDTTLVALALSVIVMLPLVLLERFEHRVLAEIDTTVGDSVIALLPEGAETVAAPLAAEDVTRAVQQAIVAHLPSPEAMVRAAEVHLRTAAESIAAHTVAAARAVTESAELLREQQVAVGEALAEEVESFQRSLVSRDQAAVAQLQASASGVASALDAVGLTLKQRADHLAARSQQIDEVLELERSLARTLHTLQSAGDLRTTLAGVDRTIGALTPLLDRLAQPRQMVLMERAVPSIDGTGLVSEISTGALGGQGQGNGHNHPSGHGHGPTHVQS